MILSPEGIVAYVTGYIQSMPAEIMRVDVFALTITLIAFFAAVVIINRLTGLLINVLKKIILFLIVALAFWQFVLMFFSRISSEGLNNDTIIFGAVGFVIGFTALCISLFVALRSFYEAGVKKPAPAAPGEGGAAPETARAESPAAGLAAGDETLAAPAAEVGKAGTVSSVKETLSISSLKNDRSLGAVLAYLVVAQFGVFSSKTIPAPSFQVGVAFFAIFVVAGLFFIHLTYNNYLTGLRHLVLAIVVGTAMAVVLGFFWGNIPLDQLLSPAFFQTDALVALVTGLALSLFMGGKG